MADPINRPEPHDEAEELLPWYATGRLEAMQRERVEAHLAECADCRTQLATERRLIEQFRSFSPEVESGWNRIAAKLGDNRRKPVRPRRAFSDFAAGLWAIFTQPAVAALATTQVAVLVFASGALLWLSSAHLSCARLRSSARLRQPDRHVPSGCDGSAGARRTTNDKCLHRRWTDERRRISRSCRSKAKAARPGDIAG